MADGILGGLFGRGDSSLLFFFLLLVIIFCKCGLFKVGSELLFFFLLLILLFGFGGFGCGRVFGADVAVD